MKCFSIKTRAKINLTLDVLNKRTDGYHDVEMVMQSINLFDELDFNLIENEIIISSNSQEIPVDNNNLVYKAAKLLKDRYNYEKGVKIILRKYIPVSAGLAGGSTNAAGTLSTLNKLWGLNIPEDTLLNLGKEIGADVPFCMMGGTALARGIGEKLTILPPLPKFYVVLVKPDISISTAWAYKQLDIEHIARRPNIKEMLKAIEENNINNIANNTINIFEQSVMKVYPEIQKIKDQMTSLKANTALMSGSGPTVYGLFSNRNYAGEAYEYFKGKYVQTYIVDTYNEEDRLYE